MTDMVHIILDPPKNLWVDFTDPINPAQAGIQMRHTIVDRLSFNRLLTFVIQSYPQIFLKILNYKVEKKSVISKM
ncbi:MAG: hypothetical protein DBP02_20340 [gamma proteobacterium symbiont of Ctena orbiculata]|nr:MAG: hypothetical protein DBP02_20340 [gamma proteobacterium symbiont of Ctena orbiculata]PUB80856.1 MAG: hypothetical protein DBP01_17070 [gamma proteobacterium symbiont of Ctena orbiculata]